VSCGNGKTQHQVGKLQWNGGQVSAMNQDGNAEGLDGRESPPVPAPEWRLRGLGRFAPAAMVVLGIAVFNFWTMPRLFYRGDTLAIKAVAINLVRYGELGIPESRKQSILGLHPSLYEHDQYLVFNPARQRYYSRWGVVATLASAVPVAVQVALGEPQELSEQRGAVVFYHNLLNIGLSCLLAILLQQIALLYTRSRFRAWLFVLSCFYATFTWYYLRAQSYELLQSVLFAGYYYYLVRCLRAEGTRARECLVNSNVCLFLLVLTKIYFCFLFGVSLVALYVAKDGLSVRPGVICGWLVANRRTVLRCVVLPGVATMAVVLALNGYQYGSVFKLGLGVPLPHRTEAPFSPIHYPAALWAYTVNPQWSLFFNFPLLLFAIPGVKRAWRGYRAEWVALLMVLLGVFAIVGAFKSYLGEWCYGPRLFLFVLPCLCFPALLWLDSVLSRRRSATTVGCLVGVSAVLLLSCWLQVNVNALAFFAKYEELDTFCTLQEKRHGTRELSPQMQRYFGWRPCGLIAADHLRAVRTGRTFPVLDALQGMAEVDGRLLSLQEAYFLALRSELLPNYRFTSATTVFYRPPRTP